MKTFNKTAIFAIVLATISYINPFDWWSVVLFVRNYAVYFIWLEYLLGFTAFILSVIAIVQIRKNKQRGTWLAIISLIISIKSFFWLAFYR